MVDDPTDADVKDDGHQPRECMPCRGTGQVMSSLGGSAHQVSCPWCAGSGLRVAGVNAQAAWVAGGGGETVGETVGEAVSEGVAATVGETAGATVGDALAETGLDQGI